MIQIVDKIATLLTAQPRVLVAIDGYGGSGKTTLAKNIQSLFAGSTIVSLDDFATDTMSGADRTRFLSHVLIPLSNAQPARYQRFDWRTKSLAEWRSVEPNGLIIFEGVSILGTDFYAYYDLRIWIDCTFELASARMRKRDKGLHNTTYFNVWEKEDRDYGKTEPWTRADVIIKPFLS
jgi:uridine kinase